MAIKGVGLGFRLGLAEKMLAAKTSAADFVEVAPENYMNCGGKRARYLSAAKERWPIVSHGLCGDFAGSAPVDDNMLAALKTFLDNNGAEFYSDHLCLTHANGAELHDLLPLPFSEEAAERAASRVKLIQERLERPVGVENISAYARAPGSVMSEPEFVSLVVERADCSLLLDVNNVYVNSINFDFDAREYIDAMPLERVIQIHIAGHEEERPGLLIDTHGSALIDPVIDLYRYTCKKLRGKNVDPPTLLERDNNIPPLAELESEVKVLQDIRDQSFKDMQ